MSRSQQRLQSRPPAVTGAPRADEPVRRPVEGERRPTRAAVPELDPIDRPSSTAPEWQEEPAEASLYVPLHDFFGGSPQAPDPVLLGWGDDRETRLAPRSALQPVDPEALQDTMIRPRITQAELDAEARRRAEQQAAADGDTKGVARASLVMAAGTMVSRLLGMVRTALLAAVLGRGLIGDAFTIANTLPNYVYILLSAGVLNAILLPQITKAAKNADGGRAFTDRLITAALGLVLLTAVIATLMAPLLISATSDLPNTPPLFAHHAAVVFAYLCLPQIAFYGLYTVLGQVLNARGQFAAFMWAPALANVVQIGGLVWFLQQWGRFEPGRVWTNEMLIVVGLTSTLGIVVQGVSLIWPLWKGGFRWTPRFDLRGHGLGQASRILGWTLTALIVAQLGGFIIQDLMTRIRGDGDVGSVLVRDQAFQIFMMPHSFVTVSILTAMFPALARAYQDADTGRMRELMKRSLSMPAVAIIPMSAAMVVLSLPIVRVLLPGANHEAVAWTLAAMAVGTMAFGVTTLQQRYCFAREDGRTNLWLQVLLTAVQVSFGLVAWLLVPARWGVFTIAVGQTVANTVAGLAFVWVARRQIGPFGLRSVAVLYAKLIACSVVAAAAADGVAFALRGVAAGPMNALLQLIFGGSVFLVVCFFALRLAKVDELDATLAPLLRRLKRS